MKRYTKNGEIKTRRQIVIKKDGMATYNPTEEMILADGWVEYVPPVYERTLSDYKRIKKEDVEMFDSSSEVNTFYIQDVPVWFDKNTRAGLKLRFEAEKSVEKENTTLWYEDNQFEIKVDSAIQMLYAVEVYASTCYDNTQKHLIAIDKLETVEEIENYNYKSGYPEKLKF